MDRCGGDGGGRRLAIMRLRERIGRGFGSRLAPLVWRGAFGRKEIARDGCAHFLVKSVA